MRGWSDDSASHILSIQQRDLLALELGGWPPARNASFVYRVSDDLPMPALRSFLSHVMQVDSALRTCRISLEEDRAWLARDPEPPLYELATPSADHTRDVLRQEPTRSFGRDGGPLWRITLVDTATESKVRARNRLLVCTFDHLISDWVSCRLFEGGLATLRWPAALPGSDYLSWIKWQRAQLASDSPSMRFWERYLSAEVLEAYRISLAPPGGPLSGTVRRSRRSVSTPASAVRTTRGDGGVSSLTFVIAAAMTSLVSAGLKEDLIAIVMCTARSLRFRRVLGCLAGWVPLRLDLSRCHDLRSALSLSHAAWSQVQPHQYLPAYGYMNSVGVSHEIFAGRLNINYFSSRTPVPAHSAAVEGVETGVNLAVERVADGSHFFNCSFDPQRIDACFIDDFLDGIVEAWSALLRVDRF